MQLAITGMSSAALVAEYNRLTGKNIKKFSSRKAAERQVASARTGKILPLTNAVEGKPEPKKAKAKPKTKVSEKEMREHMSAATKKTWKDEAVAKKRAQRHGVNVEGKHYRSVAAAFTALRLPMGRHIPFRMELKKTKRLTFKHGEKSYIFTIAEK